MNRGLSLLVAFGLAGCTSFGPGTVNRDRFDYTEAVAESWKRQMLLNLVKIRYGDTPVFFDVGQIVSAYSIQSTFSAAGSANLFTVASAHVGVPDASVGVGAQGTYIDRPTITYAPLAGERFARSLMTPVPPVTILHFIRAGYPVDVVMRLFTQEVNGVHNRHGGDLAARPADSEFVALLEGLLRIQTSGAIGLRVHRIDREEATLITFRRKVEPDVEEAMIDVRKLLGLDPISREFKVVYGALAANDKEIAILSRSVLEVLIELSSYITVPEAHVTERRVAATSANESGPDGSMPPLIHSATSVARPSDAFVAVPYRGYWFWIDDRDRPSKRLFTFLMFVFSL